MTRAEFSKRCIPTSLIVAIAVCALLAGGVALAAGGGSSPVLYASNGVSASVRSIQPAVSGLFQLHSPRVWTDAVSESGAPGANGVPDFLDTWEAFGARTNSAILKNGYAFTTVDERGQEVLYAGVQRALTPGPGSAALEFSQEEGKRLPGDLRISAEIDEAGNLGPIRFESFAGAAKGPGQFLPIAILPSEGCNDDGTACAVANGGLLEFGYNLTILGKPGKDFEGIQLRTPEDHVVGTMSALAGAPGGCVKEVGGINPVCTANDVRLAGVVSGTVIVAPGDGCNPNDPDDTVTLSFTGIFTSGPQRYDVGSYIATDGGGADGARSGLCSRFALKKNENGTTDLDGDTCGDIDAGKTLQIPVGPVTIKCADAFHSDGVGNAVAGGDGNIDFFHCETWAQSAGEINCTGSATVKAGTPSKCGCGFLGAENGFCSATADANVCDTEVCQGTCQPTSGTGGSGTTCTVNAACTVPGETCRGIHVVHVPVAEGSTPSGCDAAGGECTIGQQCQSGACVGGGFKPPTTACTSDNEVCTDDHCSGTSSACVHTANSASCSDGSACTVGDVCSGGVCTAGAAVTCPTPDQCHNAGSCDPATGLCSNPAKANGAACETGASGGACDAPDECQSGTCVEKYAASSTVCRGAGGVCDLAENCTGSSPDCPADLKSTAQCRASGGDCDVPESCDGVSNACPADSFKTSAVQCRGAAGVCDVAESCSGSSATCPADAKSTALCRASAGVCDLPESCNGTANDCPADGFQSSAVECRASAGVCDVAESCTGNSAACPDNAFKGPAVVCRARVNSCDADEHCTGSSASCGPDVCLGGQEPISYP